MNIETYKEIIDYLRDVILGTEFENHVFSVGGCERDKNLGRNIKDIDLVVDLPNGGINFAKWLEANNLTYGSVVVYENFGTVMFKLKKFNQFELEAVHTRKECYRDENSRNPETVFGTIYEDCMRRDFTINALYHNISEDKDLDFTGKGMDDLKNKIIRTCDDPNIIFKEDPLRILRCVRFKSQFDFTIEKYTLVGMALNAPKLDIISKERIQDEFNKIFNTDKPWNAFLAMDSICILKYIAPQLDNECFEIKGFIHYMIKAKVLDVYIEDRTIQALTIMMFCIGKTPINNLMKSLKYSNNIINTVNKYTKGIYLCLIAINFNKTRYYSEFEYFCKDSDSYFDILELSKLFASKDSIKPNINSMVGYKLPIDGNDVMNILNVKPSPLVKCVLQSSLEFAFKHPKTTRKMFLLNLYLMKFKRLLKNF